MGSLLLKNCQALLMDGSDMVKSNTFVAIQGETIQSVGTTRPAGSFDEEIDCHNNILMPGLVNAHTHVPMTLLRGYGGGCDLQTWLNQWIFPAEAKRLRHHHHRGYVYAHPGHCQDRPGGGHQRQPLLWWGVFRGSRGV